MHVNYCAVLPISISIYIHIRNVLEFMNKISCIEMRAISQVYLIFCVIFSFPNDSKFKYEQKKIMQIKCTASEKRFCDYYNIIDCAQHHFTTNAIRFNYCGYNDIMKRKKTSNEKKENICTFVEHFYEICGLLC